MRIDFGLILGVAIEYIIMIYYANTTLYPKKNYYISSGIGLVGYVGIFILAMFGRPILNNIVFTVVNTTIFMLGYYINYKNAIFKSVILTVISFLGEVILIFILNNTFGSEDNLALSNQKSMLITIAGKLIYFIGILVIKNMENQRKRTTENSFALLIFVPVITFICIIITLSADISKQFFTVLCIISITMNIVTFAVNEYIISKNRMIRMLEEENLQNRMKLKEYNMLSESYEQSRIFRHDVKEHINNLKILMKEDNQAAMNCIQSLENVYTDTVFIKYTDNKILNVLLIQKEKECHERGIMMHIQSTNPSIDFVDGIDIVAIFSNLINNAMEACMESEEREIFVDLCTVNEIFTVVKVENSADREPVVDSGILKTSKQDKANHGIGIKSIKNSLKKYNGGMSWGYDNLNKIFRTTVMINTKLC